MSQDPFQRDVNVPPAIPGGAPSPPAKKRRMWLRVLLILFGGGFLTLLICCGAGAYLVQNYGGVIFDPVRKDMNQMAELHDEIGELQSLNMNFIATVEEGKTNPDFVIFDGQSDRGPVQISAKMATSGELEKVFLIMSDGSRKSIDMGKRVTAPAVDVDAEVTVTDADDIPTDQRDENASEPTGENAAAPPAENTTEKPVEQPGKNTAE